MLKKHAGSSLAGSTFRRSLAALIWDGAGWTPRLTKSGRFSLSPEDNAALRTWQEKHLRVSWLHVAEPWEVEDLAIRELEPPINLRDNHEHPFYEPVRQARRFFKASALALQREDE